MKKVLIVLGISALLALSGPAIAELCTIDQVPAATLLVPYFAVDVSDDACASRTGIQTLFSVNNASATATIAHVTLWTDWSVPTLDFDIYLTGYDVQTMNLYDLFCSGNLPSTGFGVSNHGPYSGPGIAYPSCNNGNTPGNAPVYADGVLLSVPNLLDHLKAWHTGNESPVLSGQCASSSTGDIATGYITIDQTNDCSVLFPAESTYYPAGANSILGVSNQLWGDYFYLNPAQDFAQGFASVHIEALEDWQPPSGVTFYGRYTPALDLTDYREPLGTTYGARYALAGGFDGSDFFVWREGDSTTSSVGCGGAPGWWPLGNDNQTGASPLIAFDEYENVEIIPPPPISCPPEICQPTEIVLIPNETQIIAVGTDLPTGAFEFGWYYMNFQHNKTAYGVGNYGQAWATQRMTHDGRFSAGWDAIALDNMCYPLINNPGPLP